jgi:hypothetical protein
VIGTIKRVDFRLTSCLAAAKRPTVTMLANGTEALLHY